MKKIKKVDHVAENMLQDMAAQAFYQNIDPRRRQEMHDAYMVREDNNAMANLPKQAIHHEFNADKFKYDSVSAGSPDWSHNEIGFIRKAQKGFIGEE